MTWRVVTGCVTYLLALLAAGCFSPDLGSRPFLCGTDEAPCPTGYTCRAGVCQNGSAPPPIDAAVIPDATPAPDATALCARDDQCDMEQGEICFPIVGCLKVCGGGTGHYEGCEMWATPAGNSQAVSGFAVSLLNPGAIEARVRIDGAGLSAARVVTVPARGSTIEPLPWVDGLSVCKAAVCSNQTGVSGLVKKGAYRILSTVPLSVQQWSPVGPAPSSDATRLPPSRSLGKEYMTASLQPATNGLSFIAVTGTGGGTKVTVKPRANTIAGDANFPSLSAGSTTTFTVDRGDVLLFFSRGDLNGSEISADKTVQVLSGNGCTGIAGASGCSHTEEVMPPLAALPSEVLVPAVPLSTVSLRITAVSGATFVSLTDGGPVATEFILQEKGASRELTQGDGNLGSVQITSNGTGALLVTQSIASTPAMIVYHAGGDKTHLVDVRPWTMRVLIITAKTGDTIKLDGQVLNLSSGVIADSDFSRTVAQVTGGQHLVETIGDSWVTVLGADTTAGTSTFWY